MKNRWISPLAAGVFVVFGLALGVGVATTPGASAVPAAGSVQVSQPAPASTSTSPSLAAARLQGTFDLSARITNIRNFEGSVGKIDLGRWGFTPVCSGGPCAVFLTFAASANTGIIRLTRSGATYSTSYPSSVRCDSSHSAPESVTIRLQVSSAAWVDGTWRVTGWAGTIRYNSPDNHVPACGGAASETVTMQGTLKGSLSLRVVVHGPGRITSKPLGISCPGTCQASYTTGTTVTLVDHQASNGIFDHWALGCTGAGSCTFKLTAAKTVAAFFKSASPPPTPPPPPPPSPPPVTAVAQPGHYQGTTSQNEPWSFDVTSDGLGLANLTSGQINESCNPPDIYLSGGNLHLSFTIPISPNGGFSRTYTLSSSIDGQPLQSTLTLTGQFASATATGTFLENDSFTLNGTAYGCTSGNQTWTASKTG